MLQQCMDRRGPRVSVTADGETPPGSRLDVLAAIADGELGALYITPDGKIRFCARYANEIGSASVLTFGDDTAGTESEYLGFEAAADDTDLTGLDAATEWVLAVNDYIELSVFQNSGAALNLIISYPSGNYSPEFSMTLATGW